MSIIKILLLVSANPDMSLCKRSYCREENLGNGKCEISCASPFCNFDTSLSQDYTRNKIQAFIHSDCYIVCLSKGCDPNKLGNSICDNECNILECAWDLNDCGYCYKGCTLEMLNNDVCNQECKNYNCNYDMGYCSTVCGYEGCIPEKIRNPVCQAECATENCLKLFPNASCFTECSKGCHFYIQGDGLCNLECNNKDCFYDKGDCDCAPGCNDGNLVDRFCRENDPCDNESCEFKLGFCGHCNSGCFDFMLGDYKCDNECNVEACDFDHGDCGCAPGCSLIFKEGKWNLIEENKGNLNCLVANCFYNLLQDEDLFLVKWVILNQIYLEDLSVTQLREISGDCSEEKLRKIDEGLEKCKIGDECLTEEGLWCVGLSKVSNTCVRSDLFNCMICSGVMIMGKCEYLLSSCPQGMQKFQSLSDLFSAPLLTWCLLDPILYHRSNLIVFYVKSSDPPKAEGTGSENNPFQSLYFAFSQIYGIQTQIIVSSGFHVFEKNIQTMIPFRKSTFEPLNYDYEVIIQKLVIEGESKNNPSIIYWKGSVSISSKARVVYIKNIIFKGDKILRNECDGSIDFCMYCPFYDPVNNLDDKGKTVPENLKKFYSENNCAPYKNDELFKFKGKVNFENVTFMNFRHQFNTLINIEGSLNLTRVNFVKIQPKVLGYVLRISCFSDCKNENFVMQNSLVEDFNYGYDEREGIESGSFLVISRIHSAYISENTFKYNFLISHQESINPSYFIKLENLLGTITIEKCFFRANLFNHIINIDTKSLIYDSLDLDRYDQSQSYSQTHLKLHNINFDYIFISGHLIKFEMYQFEQNINIKNVTLNNFYSISSEVFKIQYYGAYIKYIYDTIEYGSRLIWKKPSVTYIENILLKNSLLNSTLFDIRNLKFVKISNILCSNILTRASPITSYTKKEFETAKKYLKISGPTIYKVGFFGYCGKTVYASNNANLEIYNISIQDWDCFGTNSKIQGVHTENTLELLIISNITGLNLVTKIENGMLLTVTKSQNEVLISDIIARNTKNVIGSIISFDENFNVSINAVKLENCETTFSAALDIKSIIYKILLRGLIFLDNLSHAGMASCIYFDLSDNTPLIIDFKDAYFFKCKGLSTNPSLLIDSSLFTSCSLILTNLKFDTCDSAASSIFKITSRVDFPLGSSNITGIEIVNSNSASAAMIELNNEGTINLDKIFTGNNSAIFAGIYVGSLPSNSKFINVFNSVFSSSVSIQSVINIRTIINYCQFYFENLTIFNITANNSSSIVFDIAKSLINGTSLTVFNAGGLVSADQKSKVLIDKGVFYQINKTVVSIVGESEFICSYCKFFNNYNKIIKCLDLSRIYLKSTEIFNNHFNQSGQSLIEISLGSADIQSLLQNTLIYENFIEKGKLLYLLTSSLVMENSSIVNNQANENEYNGLEVVESNLIVKNSIFANQTSMNTAPFIHCYSKSIINISYSSFSSSFSSVSAGAVYASSSSLSVDSTEFKNNSAGLSGGGIYATYSDVLITNTSFSLNSAILSGGSIYGIHSEITIRNSSYSLSSANNATTMYFESCIILLDAINLTTFVKTFSDEVRYSAIFISSFVQIISSYFSQLTIGVSALHFIECESVTITDSIFFKFQTVLFGSVTYIGKTVYGNLKLSSTNFINNECKNFGGALYLKNGKVDISNCLFTNNTAYNGGAIYFEAPDCLNCKLRIRNNSKFFENTAKSDGGCLKWVNSKPDIDDSSVFEKNSAIYGNDFASIPAYLSLSNDSYIKDKNFDLELKDVAPGQVYSDSILVYLLDTYNQTVSTDDQSLLKIEPHSSSTSFSLRVITSFQPALGIFNLSGFYVGGTPDSEQYLRIFCPSLSLKSFENNETFYRQDLIVKVYLRGCINGEQVGVDSCKICEENKYLIRPESKCKLCPKGGICPGGDRIYVKYGFYRTHHLSEILYPCDLESSCLGNPNDFVTVCYSGYTGIKCGVCEKGYSKTSSLRCNKCPDHQTNILMLLIILAIVLFILAYFVRMTIKSAYYPKSKQSIYIKIFTNYLHLIYMVSQLNLNWPENTLKFFEFYRSSSILTESIISIDCYIRSIGSIETYYIKLFFIAILPLIIFFVSFVVWLIISFLNENYSYMKREVFLNIIIVYFLIFPNIVKLIFASFDCTDFDIIGEFLTTDYSIKCSTSIHKKYLIIISLPSILLWIFCFPLLILMIMIKRRKKLTQENNKIIFGLFFNGYNLSIFYWEFIILYRKVLIICIIVFVKQISAAVQGNFLLILLLLSYATQNKLNPYDSKELNLMEKDALIAAIITNFSGLFFLTDNLNDFLNALCFCFLIVGNLKFLSIWIFWITKSLFELSIKIIPCLSYLKKGDAFEEDFFSENIIIEGIIPQQIKGRKTYTFIKKPELEKNDFSFWSINDLFKAYVTEESDDFSRLEIDNFNLKSLPLDSKNSEIGTK